MKGIFRKLLHKIGLIKVKLDWPGDKKRGRHRDRGKTVTKEEIWKDFLKGRAK